MYLHPTFSAVAAVTIVESKYTREFMGDSHPWSAFAVIDTLLVGGYDHKTVTFRRGWGSSTCQDDIDDDNVRPKPGDKWILYFSETPHRGQEVKYSYPFDVAAGADRALGPTMKPNASVKPNVPMTPSQLDANANGGLRIAPPNP